MTANPLPPIPPISATSGIAPPPGGGRFKPIDPMKVLRQHMTWLIAAGVLGFIVGVGLYLALNAKYPRYTSQAQLVVSAPNLDATSAGGIGNASGDAMDRYKATEAYRIRSEEILRQAIDNPLVRNTNWFKQFASPTQAREQLAKDYLSVSPMRGSNIIVVSVSTPIADDAPRILQSVVDVYLREVSRDAQGNLTQNQRAMEDQRALAEDEMKRLERDRNAFLTTNDLTTLNTQHTTSALEHQKLLDKASDLQAGLSSTRQLAAMLQAKMEAGDYTPTPDAMQQIEMAPDILAIQHRINSLEETVKANTDKWGENHSITLDSKRLAAAAQGQKKQELDRKIREYQTNQVQQALSSIQSLEGQLKELEAPLRETKARMADLNAKIAQYQSIVRQLEGAEERRDHWNAALANLGALSKRSDYIAVRLYASPTDPEKTFPKLAVVVGGSTLLLLGAVAGLIFLKELLDQRIKSPADVKLLADAELLGIIPNAAEDPSGPTGVERVVEKYPTGLLAESFREVRTALLAKMDRRGYRTLMIVGGQPQAGVSTVAHNLATSLAYNGRNVVIVDVNFRRPAQHRLVGISNEVGVADVIHQRAGLGDAVTKLDGLSVSVLPTGAAADEAPECLESPAFRSMLAQLENDYDVVIIDAPPALLASESQLLAKHVDALAVVVRAMADKRGMVERMTRRLDGHRADILGVVLNGVRSSAGGYFRKNYRDFYRYRAAAETGGRGIAPAPTTSDDANAHRNGNGAFARTDGASVKSDE